LIEILQDPGGVLHVAVAAVANIFDDGDCLFEAPKAFIGR
jgi:hypothetical protein